MKTACGTVEEIIVKESDEESVRKMLTAIFAVNIYVITKDL